MSRGRHSIPAAAKRSRTAGLRSSKRGGRHHLDAELPEPLDCPQEGRTGRHHVLHHHDPVARCQPSPFDPGAPPCPFGSLRTENQAAPDSRATPWARASAPMVGPADGVEGAPMRSMTAWLAWRSPAPVAMACLPST